VRAYHEKQLVRSQVFRKSLIEEPSKFVVGTSLSMAQYELLKCANCGKTLGYITINVKMFPPKFWTRLVAGGPLIKIEKDAFCEECFKQLQNR